MAALGIDPDDRPSAAELAEDQREIEEARALDRESWVDRYADSLGWNQ